MAFAALKKEISIKLIAQNFSALFKSSQKGI